MRGMLGNFTAENSHGKIDKHARAARRRFAPFERGQAPPATARRYEGLPGMLQRDVRDQNSVEVRI